LAGVIAIEVSVGVEPLLPPHPPMIEQIAKHRLANAICVAFRIPTTGAYFLNMVLPFATPQVGYLRPCTSASSLWAAWDQKKSDGTKVCHRQFEKLQTSVPTSGRRNFVT
jgi:hypothetical protein